MQALSVSDFLEARYHEFSRRYDAILNEKIKGFFNLDEATLTIDHRLAPDQLIYGDRLIILLISGKDLKATLKIHFNPSEVEALVPPMLLEASESMAQAIFSLFAELGNLLAGAIKSALLEMKYLVGISLPILASCYDELISSDSLIPNRVYAFTAVEIKGRGQFVATLSIDNEGPGLSEYKFQPKELTPESDFL